MDLFKSEHIFLRTLEPFDIGVLCEWENDSSIWYLSNTHKPFAKHTLQAFIDEAHLDLYTTKSLRLVICLNTTSEPVGAIDLFDFDPFHLRAGIGILIADSENRSKGYATEALTIMINYCRDLLMLNQLYCNILINNTESIVLFEKCGFEKCGLKKKWHNSKDGFLDEGIFQLILK